MVTFYLFKLYRFLLNRLQYLDFDEFLTGINLYLPSVPPIFSHNFP